MDEIKDLDSLKEQFTSEGVVLPGINVLFLDLSSTCTGYSIAKLDFVDKSAEVTKAGAIWFDSNWENVEKYSYIFNAIVNYFWVVEQIDYIVIEQYSINPKKMMGGQVLPELTGVVKVAANENGIKVSSILPQSWRSILGIKAKITTDAKGKKSKDFKTPVKEYVDKLMQVPADIRSNITKNLRATPHDLYDSVGIALAWVTRLGFKNIKTDNVQFNTHVGVIE